MKKIMVLAMAVLVATVASAAQCAGMTKKGEQTDVLPNGWTVVTRDRCLSAHFEHTVAITDDGCEILTLPADYP